MEGVVKYNKQQLNTHNILLQWCEETDARSVLKKKIHSCRGKHKKERYSFRLNINELKYIKIKGLTNIREDISYFISSNLKQIKYDNNHPIHCVKYVCAFCCRNCIEDIYNIPTWKKLSDDDINNITSLAMKWIQHKYNK